MQLFSGTYNNERDGETYKWVKIGRQIWMAENLKAMVYVDGIQIPVVAESSTWKNLGTGALCWLNNDRKNRDNYGGFYNWFTL